MNRVARLLVSVRSAEEARAALEGGAAVIDVKEPARGPLGRADVAVWRAVLEALPGRVPVSVALGELGEWLDGDGPAGRIAPADFLNLTYRKLGLADCGPGWADRWARLRRHLDGGPPWVAVAYADWRAARAPEPTAVLDVALANDDCAGVLVDTWDKSAPSPVDLSWGPWFVRAHEGGRFTALAGRLDRASLARLAPLRPDIVAVRGAACVGGDRLAPIDPERVSTLARAVAAL